MKRFQVFGGLVLLAIGIGLGWFGASRSRSQSAPVSETPATIEPSKVVAQGRILPISGLINIYAPPNQRIEQVLIREGDTVVAGQELATFTGQAALQLQSEMVDSQGDDSKRELAQRIMAAEGTLLAAGNAVSAAQLQLHQIEQEDSSSTAEQQVQAAREKLSRMKELADDPTTRLFVSRLNLMDQSLALVQAETQLRQAVRKRDNALQAARLNLELAQKTQQQAEAGLESLRTLQKENRTLQLSQSIADTTFSNSKLIAPLSATVLKVNGKPGEVLLQSPLIQLGDLSKLVCVAEVMDRLVHQVHVGQSVTIIGPALVEPIHGKVTAIGRVVGTGILSDPNPLAVMDRKTVDVKIELDLTAEQIAKQLINLQVTVEIQLQPPSGGANR